MQGGIIQVLDETDGLSSWFVNPIILPKGDYIKLVSDARYLNSVTNTKNSSWPLQPLKLLITRIKVSFLQAVICLVHVIKSL